MPRRKKTQTTADPATVKTRQQLADLLGKSVRMVGDYLARGMKAASAAALGEGETGYSVAACRAWLAEHLPPTPIDVGGFDAIHKLTVAKLNEELRFRRLKNDKMAGLVIDRAAVKQAWNEALLRIQARLEAWPDELEMLWPPESRAITKAELIEKTRLLLQEMSQWSQARSAPEKN